MDDIILLATQNAEFLGVEKNKYGKFVIDEVDYKHHHLIESLEFMMLQLDYLRESGGYYFRHLLEFNKVEWKQEESFTIWAYKNGHLSSSKVEEKVINGNLCHAVIKAFNKAVVNQHKEKK